MNDGGDGSPQAVDGTLTHRVLRPRTPVEGLAPALLMLHGRGADELDLLGLADSLDPRLLVVSARAPARLGFGYHWYDLLDIGRPEPRSFVRSLELLKRFAGELGELYGADPARLYLLGFSQGAMMSGSLTVLHPQLVAGTVMLSGYLPLAAGLDTDPAKLKGQPFYVAHGTQDPVIPVSFGREAREYLRSVGADLTYSEYPMGHQIALEELEDVSAWLTSRLDTPALQQAGNQ